METINHKNGSEVVVQYFGNLKEKLSVSSGYVNAVNSFSRMQTEQDGILRPTLDSEAAHKAIIKQHNKFYGNSKYDGKGNLREE